MCVMVYVNFTESKNLILSESNTIKNSCEVRVATGLPLIQPLDLQTFEEVPPNPSVFLAIALEMQHI